MTSSRTALITGATAGIGAEFARQLAALGYDLVIVARDIPRLTALASELSQSHGVEVEVLSADLLDEAQVVIVENRLRARASPIDYLVNNAGFGLKGEFDEKTIDEELSQFDILARVPLRLTHAALEQMLPRQTGTVLTVSSIAGFAGLGSYAAVKSWSIVFTRWANPYYRARGVTFTALTPGFVRTEFHARIDVTRESMAASWLWLDAPFVVRRALKDAARGRAISIPSARYRVIAWLARLTPPIIAVAVGRRGRQWRRSSDR
jgi:short-subunit dehydrogenase